MLAPVVSSILFIVVFGLSLGTRIKEVEGFPYDEFIVPGLIAMAMAQAAYSNNSSSIFQARSDHYIHDVLSAPDAPVADEPRARDRRRLPGPPDRRRPDGARDAADRRRRSRTRSPWPPRMLLLVVLFGALGDASSASTPRPSTTTPSSTTS